jgi:hypothetical protein
VNQQSAAATGNALIRPTVRLCWFGGSTSLVDHRHGANGGQIKPPIAHDFPAVTRFLINPDSERWRGHQLDRERPAYNPIGNSYLEMVVARDASNPLAAHLCESGTGDNMNLLLGLTA